MKFINSINHYRAIAIIIIVAAHSFTIAEIKFDAISTNIFRNLLAGGTMNFVFISGFLFHAIFYKKFRFGKFFNGKFSKIILPYLILSIIPIIIAIQSKPNYWNHSGYLCDSNFSEIGCVIFSGINYLITGSHLVSYWYIPFVSLLFLMSPLHKKYIELSTKTQLFILVILSCISLFLHRPYDNTSIFKALHSLVYFTPFYLFGIICSIHKEKIYRWLKNKELVLLALVIGIAYYQNLLDQSGLYFNEFFQFENFPDLIFVQKIFMCLFFMVFLNRFEDRQNAQINAIAKLSFPIFFLHGYVLRGLTVLKAHYSISIEQPWLVYFSVLIFLILTSMFIAELISRLTPLYSRNIIGYGKKSRKKQNLAPKEIIDTEYFATK